MNNYPQNWTVINNPEENEYYRDLDRRQKEHLAQIPMRARPFKPCRHDSCPECVGTGLKKDGTICVHNIHCDCPKCITYC